MPQLGDNNRRIEYIDAMRGFTMLLVILSHIHMFCYGGPLFYSYNYIFLKVRMPLFFLLVDGY